MQAAGVAMRDVVLLEPETRWRCRALIAVAERIFGIPLLVHQTLRTPQEQAAIYAKGRTAKGEPPYTPERPLGRTVTNAPPGSSWHEYGRAFDVVPLDEGGNPDWNASPLIWDQLGVLGEALGLEWGGRWKMRDLGHFQLRPDGYTSASEYGARCRRVGT